MKKRYRPGEKVCLVADPHITGCVKEMNSGLIQASWDNPLLSGRTMTDALAEGHHRDRLSPGGVEGEAQTLGCS